MTNFRFEGENIPPELLPKPAGWRVLVGMLKVEDTSKGGIILANEHVEGKKYLRSVAKVLAVGPGTYQHAKFQGGISIEKRDPEPWAKVGDVVLVGQYAGQSISVKDCADNDEPQSLKLMNDDEILAVIPDMSVINT